MAESDPPRWTLEQAVKVAADAGWLASTGMDGDLTEQLNGEIGDAAWFMAAVRNLAVHPASLMRREETAPDFEDAAHMRATYEVFDGIMAAVFAQLNTAIRRLAPPKALT